MMLELTPRELEFLISVLEREQQTLIHELNKTDSRDFRALVRNREDVCEALLDKVAKQTTAA